MMKLKIFRLSPAIGAIVEGIDLSSPLDRTATDLIKNALVEYQVLFFRGQKLTPLQQYEFAANFGELHIHPIYPKIETIPEVMILDTKLNDLRDNAIWHTDVTFIKTPPLGAVLTAQVLPEYGGDTLWSSGIAAWKGLSPYFQEMLKSLTATHEFIKSFPLARFGNTSADLARYEETKLKNPPVVHPVIRTHPESKEKSIFINEGFTTYINELEPKESEIILQFLFAHCSKPEYSIRWKWQAGDVAFWDNRVTQHYAIDDYRPIHRVMHRVTILGDVPY